MVEDAKFEDGGEAPLRLMAESEEDLSVIAALVQDAVLPATEMKWERGRRRFSCLINRFRWEDKAEAEKRGRSFERVQSVLAVDDVLGVARQGVDPTDPDMVLSLLGVTFEPTEDGAGRLELAFAGDGAIGIDVESINIALQDVTRPYRAVSGKAPAHKP